MTSNPGVDPDEVKASNLGIDKNPDLAENKYKNPDLFREAAKKGSSSSGQTNKRERGGGWFCCEEREKSCQKVCSFKTKKQKQKVPMTTKLERGGG